MPVVGVLPAVGVGHRPPLCSFAFGWCLPVVWYCHQPLLRLHRQPNVIICLWSVLSPTKHRSHCLLSVFRMWWCVTIHYRVRAAHRLQLQVLFIMCDEAPVVLVQFIILIGRKPVALWQLAQTGPHWVVVYVIQLLFRYPPAIHRPVFVNGTPADPNINCHEL